MKPSSYARISALAALSGSLALIGCGGAMSLPDAVVSPQAAGHSLQGKVFGGHAPIVGMHVYLAQPGTSDYGSAANSILTTGTANVSDPGVTVGAMYATSDSTGAFSFGPYTCVANQPVFVYGYGGSPLATPPSGYTLQGGGVTTVAPETVSITGISVAGAANNGTQDTSATYTITVGSALPLTAGQTVTIAGLTGNLSILNGTQTASAATTGANTTFTITASPIYGDYTYSYYKEETKNDHGGYTYSEPVTGTYYETVGNGAYTATKGQAGDDGGGDDNDPNPNYDFTVTGGTPGSPSTGTAAFGAAGTATASESTTSPTTYTPTTNPIVQLASLGICGSAAFDALNYVYMNEVSTIAAAYTFQPFTLPTNNNAWDIGSSGTTQALTGIENAAETAAQLYAVAGNTRLTTTDPQDGEGHVANYQTQNGGPGGTPNQGNGVVPQATIDTLANILAACIDSAVGTDNSLETPCTTLFNTATDGGSTVASGDTAATDTATAAINIARYPAGNGSGTPDSTYVKDLFGILSGTVPYAPDLANAPNDWTIAINYPYTAVSGYKDQPGPSNTTLYKAESVEVDDAGQIWITAQGTAVADASAVRWSPLGVQNSISSAGYIYGYVSIDGSNNAWAGNAECGTKNSGCTGGSGIEEFDTNGVLTNTYGSSYDSAYTVVTDSAGDAFFVAAEAGAGGTGGDYQLFEYGPGGSGPGEYTISPAEITAGDDVGHGAIDASGYLWLTTESSYQIARVLPNANGTVTKAFTPVVTDQQPEFPSIDHEGNAWIAIQAEPAAIYEVSPTGGTTILTSTGNNFGGHTTTSTGATLSATFGSAVDGNGNVWFANRCDLYSADTSCTDTANPLNSIVEIHGAAITGVPAGDNPGTTLQAISPVTNYVPEAQYPSDATAFTPMLDDSLNLAIDPSGNVWITNYIGNSVVEIVGAAAPVVTPLSVAAGSGKLGIKP